MKSPKIAVHMALILLSAAVISACGDSAAEPSASESFQTTPTADSEPAIVTEKDLRAQILDDLPQTNMDGYTFRIFVRERGDFVEDVGLELEASGDIVNDAIYSRNKLVAERFNCVLQATAIKDDGASLTRAVTQSIQSNEDAFDLVMGQITTLPNLAPEGYFLDWYEELPHIDLTKPWYIGNAAAATSVDGHSYVMIGEYNLDALRFTYCMYFNKQLAENHDLENLYTVVKDGRWTYDYLYKLSTEIYDDLNGDGKKGEEDLLCLSGDPYSAIVTYQYAFDNPIFRVEAGGTPLMVFNTEKANAIVSKLNDLYWNTPGGYTKDWGTGMSTWDDGRLLFYTGFFASAKGYRDLSFDFGIIPYPKYDDAQAQYYTMSDGAHSCMAVPITISNPEYTSIIIEALNAETYKQVVPAYFDTALKVKYSRDDESGEILDLLMDSRVFDFGYIYNNGLAFVIQQLVSVNSSNSESRYTSQMKASQKSFAKIIDAYQDLNH